jgi:protein-tyrosine phosphatase
MARVSAANVVPVVVNSADALGGGTLPLARALKRAYRATFSLYDRIRHPQRHLLVCRRLANAPRPRRILVVCHGNMCRSPYLQAVLQRSLPDVSVTSTGFVGSDRAVPQLSVAVAAQRGLDLSRHRSRPIAQPQVIDADLIIVMDAGQAQRVARMFGVKRERIVIAGDLAPMFEGTREIRDPWNQSLETFKSSFDRLDRCAATVAGLLPIK